MCITMSDYYTCLTHTTSKWHEPWDSLTATAHMCWSFTHTVLVMQSGAARKTCWHPLSSWINSQISHCSQYKSIKHKRAQNISLPLSLGKLSKPLPTGRSADFEHCPVSQHVTVHHSAFCLYCIKAILRPPEATVDQIYTEKGSQSFRHIDKC